MDELIIDGAKYETNFTRKYELLKSLKPPKLNKSEIRAFIPGQITDIPAVKGKVINAGKNIISLEAMKMINEIVLDYDIQISEIYVKAGDIVEKNQILIKYSIPKTKKKK
ncbi:MAG: acetyl-CoA carboxylase biotin carboxyl carrier protein subunit [Candidatus Delongbacteria bacterium]|jgi:pyruvate carboxylase|nr:acetyl-CoA carboxylase biotin carboxyl carrier protein subunit [Candidatus Delongbacteria bacterium]MDD4204796.1 acetyl-CoA carboxylase biotin carboxyl carrier protein subunit [Candidatus Delongbacteria bacterium]MDY0016420.1 biotin/lipoyl-containing protein [Candidatus Delongbacteria bacterium]